MKENATGTDWDALKRMKDGDVDTGDIPELKPAFFKKAKLILPGKEISISGKDKAVLKKASSMSVSSHPAFGMWAGRTDMEDVQSFVRDHRKKRGL